MAPFRGVAIEGYGGVPHPPLFSFSLYLQNINARERCIADKTLGHCSLCRQIGLNEACLSADWAQRSLFVGRLGSTKPVCRQIGLNEACSSADWAQRSLFFGRLGSTKPVCRQIGLNEACLSVDWGGTSYQQFSLASSLSSFMLLALYSY